MRWCGVSEKVAAAAAVANGHNEVVQVMEQVSSKNSLVLIRSPHFNYIQIETKKIPKCIDEPSDPVHSWVNSSGIHTSKKTTRNCFSSFV